MSAARWALTLAVVAHAACSGDDDGASATVLVDADEGLAITRVTLTVTALDAASDVVVHTSSLDVEALALARSPWTTRIVPQRSGDPGHRLYRFRAEAFDGDELVVATQHRLVFVPRTTLVLVLRLEAACLRRDCGVDETCTAGDCVDDFVPACSLVEGERPDYCDHEPAPDAAARDGARDASTIGPDASDGAALDGPIDPTGDAGADSTIDPGMDGAIDPGMDSAIDSAIDPGTDGAIDSAIDASVEPDAAMPDTGPPVGCTTSADCPDDGNLCTEPLCPAGTCVVRVLACDDANECTDDACNPGTGICESAGLPNETGCTLGRCCGGRCSDPNVDPANCGACGTSCLSPTPSCLGGTCGSCATPADCPDDGLDCTGTGCRMGICLYALAPGNCLIDGACVAEGAAEPGNPCRACVTGVSIADWSPSPGAPCDDGLYCTTPDSCDDGGNCTGAPRACPPPGTACETASCDEGADACTSAITTGCLIDGACRAESAINLANACEECRSASSRTAWSSRPVGSDCDDGLYCVMGETCDGSGACLGEARFCEDLSACRLEACNEAMDSCDGGPVEDGTPCGPMGELICVGGLCSI